MLPHYFSTTQDKDIVDMDTNERIRYMSESSMSGTSGYSTTSPGPCNSSNSSNYSPVQSPASALQTDFSNLALPETGLYQQQSPQYVQLQSMTLNQQTSVYSSGGNNLNSANSDLVIQYNFGGNLSNPPIMQGSYQQQNNVSTYAALKRDYPASLRVTEQPVEKFRFRYKSEMHGTHGSLNGTNSSRSTKSFPEVELFGYPGPAIIRCSLFQTNRDSPHSHQLVVRKDEHDICDPHELKVSQELGYFAEFKNMGIIHTAKKFIVEELLKKKRKRLQFELGRDDLTTKEEQELYKQTEKEAKDMNLNQVRLCFEAFRLEDNNLYTPIAAPVYSNAINNRKSAQTGELRITRLSIAAGSVSGGQNLILLVEKVSKKNIKVRFFEMNDDELVWEAFATFRESDVHHQYAIVCRTPAYKDKDIDKPVDIFIELMRPSDDERSYPPVSFRYKPRDEVIARKRRRTCSIASGSSGSNSGSLSSGDIPKTVVQEHQQPGGIHFSKTLSEELDKLLTNPEYKQKFKEFSEEGIYNDFMSLMNGSDNAMNTDTSNNTSGKDEKDGAPAESTEKLLHYKKMMISKKLMDSAKQQQQKENATTVYSHNSSSYVLKISEIYHKTKSAPQNSDLFRNAAEQVAKLYSDHSDRNGESLMHEMVISDNTKFAMTLCHILRHFKLQHLFNSMLNMRNQTPLHCSCLHGRPNYIRPLLNLDCNPNTQDSKGDTALHIAVREGKNECLESLLHTNKDLQLNIRNDEGFTPLHLAIRDNNIDMASKLLKLDNTTSSVPNSTDGNNALHITVQQQNLELVKLILDSQSTTSLVTTTNTAGHTPLDMAKQYASTSNEAGQILSLLLTYTNTSASTIPFSDLDDNCSNLVIKEEELSASSTEDEDDDSSEAMTTLPLQHTISKDNDETIMDIHIKEEPIKEERIEATDLEFALDNKDIFEKLYTAFESTNTWKQTLEIPQFFLTDARVMLNYVQRNVQNTKICNTFALTLQDIDKNLLDLITK